MYLVDINPEMCKAWEHEFKGYEEVKVIQGSFDNLDFSVDCMITAGNSYGIMDGGIDLAVRNYFGMEVERQVKSTINIYHSGELNVGSSILIATKDSRIRNLCYTPTMRVPKSIVGTDNIYRAFKSALEVLRNEGLATFQCCGLGALTGQVPYHIVAYQMRLAYDLVIGRERVPNWVAAKLWDKDIYKDPQENLLT